MLEENGIRYCVIGGVGVNAYAEPVVTLDLDVAVAAEDLTRVRELAGRQFRVREFEHSLNVYDPGSKLQVQVSLSPELSEIVPRATVHEVLDLMLPVAAPEDLLDAKVAAAMDAARRPSERLKDILDLARLLSVFPELAARVPAELRARLEPFIDRRQDGE